MPRATTKLSPMEASLQRLESLKNGSRALHYKVARECSILLKDEEYLSNRRESNKRLDAMLEELLPGMTKTTLELMYDQFPNKADWDKLGFTEIRDRAFKSLEKPKPPKKAVVEDKVHVDVADDVDVEDAQTPAVEAGPKMDVLGRPNEGGEWFAGKTKAAWMAMEGELNMLRGRAIDLENKVTELNAKLVELMMDRDHWKSLASKK